MGDATHKSAISSLQEVRDLIKELPEPDLESAKKAASHDAQLTKPLGSLGKLEDLVEWLASWQAEYPPRLNHPCLLYTSPSPRDISGSRMPSSA